MKVIKQHLFEAANYVGEDKRNHLIDYIENKLSDGDVVQTVLDINDSLVYLPQLNYTYFDNDFFFYHFEDEDMDYMDIVKAVIYGEVNITDEYAKINKRGYVETISGTKLALLCKQYAEEIADVIIDLYNEAVDIDFYDKSLQKILSRFTELE